jgi:hypothetical protein
MVKIHDGVIGPKLFLHFLPGNDFASGFNQHSQDLKRLLPEKDSAANVAASRREEFARAEVNLKFSKPDAARPLILHSTFHPGKRPFPGWKNPE